MKFICPFRPEKNVINPAALLPLLGVLSLLDHHVRVGPLGRGRLHHAGGPVVVHLLALPHHTLVGAVAGVARTVVPAPDPPALVRTCRSWRSSCRVSVPSRRSSRSLVGLLADLAVPVTARRPKVSIITGPVVDVSLLTWEAIRLKFGGMTVRRCRAVLGLLMTVGQLKQATSVSTSLSLVYNIITCLAWHHFKIYNFLHLPSSDVKLNQSIQGEPCFISLIDKVEQLWSNKV